MAKGFHPGRHQRLRPRDLPDNIRQTRRIAFYECPYVGFDKLKIENRKLKIRNGFTLVESIVAMAAASIVMLSAAILVSSGYRGWNQTFNNTNLESRLGALDTMIALGAVGRKSNKINYCLYEVDGTHFEKVVPVAEPEEVVVGQAAEFRYWDTELDADLVDPTITATAYALFYLDTDTHKLKVDYGPYGPQRPVQPYLQRYGRRRQRLCSYETYCNRPQHRLDPNYSCRHFYEERMASIEYRSLL